MNEAQFLQRLFALPPIQRALADTQYRLVRRPVDCRWADARLTSRVTGFEPLRHEFYYSSTSQLASWLDGRREGLDLPVLMKEALALAHDYLHSWAYRYLDGIDPALTAPRLDSDEDIERHSFLLVLTECVAVVGLDYWYLCNASGAARCGADGDFGGPLTVNYREALLPTYRLADPNLAVRTPDFFHKILALYAEGRMSGVDEDDLFRNEALADWLVRELLISPRQRTLARRWVAHRAGRPHMVFDDEGAVFKGWVQRSRPVLEQLANALWDAMNGEAGPPPPREPWSPGAMTALTERQDPQDYRFVHWRLAPLGLAASDLSAESWASYVDQIIGHHEWPDDAEVVAAIRDALPQVRAQGSSRTLLELLAPCRRLEQHDAAPDHFIIVN